MSQEVNQEVEAFKRKLLADRLTHAHSHKGTYSTGCILTEFQSKAYLSHRPCDKTIRKNQADTKRMK